MPHTLSKDGLRIHFEASASGAPALLLHPNHATCRSWVDLGWFDVLASSGFRAVAIDARGFGGSEDVKTAQHLRPGTSTEDITAVLNLLDIDAVHVCGFSLGAAAAVRLAFDVPDRVKSLALGGLGVGPLVQMGLYLGSTADDARREALTRLDRVRPSSDRIAHYFRIVREVIEAVPLARVGAEHLRAPILGVLGAADPQNPALLYEHLRGLGAAIDVRELSDIDHGACFSDSRFREATLGFLAASVAV